MPQAQRRVEKCASLHRRLEEARALTDELFRAIHPTALYERPIAERHRLIFYLGHLEAFDWNLLGRNAFALEPHDIDFDKLFAFGIDPTDGKLPEDQPGDWPKEPRVRAYCQRVRERLDAALNDSTAAKARPLVADGALLHVAIEHRLMHAETLAYLLHQLPSAKKSVRADAPILGTPHVAPLTVEIPDGIATLGQQRDSADRFGWDNEFEQCEAGVPRFAIDVYPVTNTQFLEFLRASGYDDRSLWSDADWEWKESAGIRHPHFWVKNGADWHYRAMSGEIPLSPEAPAYVTHAEAAAYARWAGKSLPTEAQWHRAAYGSPERAERLYPWGDAPPDVTRGNFDFARWDSTAVNAHPAGASAFGVRDLLGNGWEWTSTLFGPLPGFQPFPFYPGYSADFFDGNHYVMKGGSSRTAACLLRRSFRNWFQPHYPYAYAKFRCVEN